ncbi:MAG: hypothetical protein ACOCWL_01330, partial [Thermoguttaceae bacterium]
MTRTHLRPLLLSLSALLLLSAGPLGCPPADPHSGTTGLSALPPEAETTLLTDFSDDLPAGDHNATITLTFEDIRPLRDKKAGNVTVQLARRDGQWAPD